MRGTTTLAGATIVGLLAVGSVGIATDDPVDPVASPGGGGHVVAASAALQRYDGCDDLADDMRQAGMRQPWALLGSRGDMVAMDGAGVAAEAAAGSPAARARAATLQGTSDTNVQVAGVDEPDVVETDGRRLFTVSDGSLEVLDASGPSPVRLASVPLEPQGGEARLLLDGDRLLVVAPRWTVMPQPLAEGGDRAVPAPEQPTTAVWLFDVAGDQPTLVAELELEGRMVAGRGVDGSAHLVVAHRPTPLPMDVLQSELAAGGSAQAASTRIRGLLADTSGQDWLPRMTHVDAEGTRTTTPSMACTDVARTEPASTPATLQVVTLDLHDDDARPEDATGLATDAQAVTATADRLVVATAAPVTQPTAPREPTRGAPAPIAPDAVAPVPTSVDTRLHLFDLGPGGASHRASGTVEGQLLDPFAMSLHGEHLRVATTTGQFEIREDGRPATESAVHVLAARGGELQVVGSVGGLGETETIHSVRFLGDEAYVVTFRRTDPLYRVDLSDPTHPRVTGALKITGYSAYLHPLGPNRLLGVGQDATTEGQTTGTQVSIFDVSDPVRPRLASKVRLPGATSEAEWDHHAVLVHDDLLVLPFERWSGPEGGDLRAAPQVGALVVELRPQLRTRGILEVGTDTAEPWQQAIRRALVVDGRLVTVSRTTVTTWDAEALAPTGQLTL